MIRNTLESKELRELWKIKEEAFQEVSDCKTIDEMVAKRIKICKKNASRFRKRNKMTA